MVHRPLHLTAFCVQLEGLCGQVRAPPFKVMNDSSIVQNPSTSTKKKNYSQRVAGLNWVYLNNLGCYALRSTFQVNVSFDTVSKDAFLIRTCVTISVASRSLIGVTIELAVKSPRDTLMYCCCKIKKQMLVRNSGSCNKKEKKKKRSNAKKSIKTVEPGTKCLILPPH